MWEMVKGYFAEFKVLKETPREFWILNLIINFCEMLAYFSFITVLTLYLSENVGFSDEWAGWVTGLFTLLLTITIFFAGTIFDSIGVKRGLLISMGLLIPCRLVMGLLGPIENNYLEGHIDVPKAILAIEEERANERVFTLDDKKLNEAQVDLVAASPDFPTFGITRETLSEDAKALREKLLLVAAANPALTAAFPDGVEEKVKDQDGLKEVVIRMVSLSDPSLRDKYIVNLTALQGQPDKLKEEVIRIVRAYPSLREQFSIQDLLKGVIILILVFTAFGEALMTPGIYVAIRRYTNKKSCGAGFNFQYLTMNIGAVLSFAAFDPLRAHFGNESIILAGSILATICTLAVYFGLRANIEIQDDGTVIQVPPKPKEEKTETPWKIMGEVIREKAFWRFMLFILLLLGVRLTFTHQFLVMPKYYDRVLGVDAPIGLLNTINPIIITIGLVLLIPVLNRFSLFKMILVGTTISALSVFAMVVPGSFVASFGFSIEQGYLITNLVQIVIFAFGELIWSPRLSEYTTTIAPKGREGTYMSLAALPMFFAKPVNAILSGFLLSSFCPKGVLNEIVSGTRTFINGPEMMWLILGVLALSSPILIVVLKNVINPDNAPQPAATVDKEGEGA